MRPVVGMLMMGVLASCGDDSALRGGNEGLASDPGSASVWAGGSGADLTVDDLECSHGGSVGDVEVVFDCFEITTVSCKDLSNVVIELADGSRQRFEGLSGQRGVFRADRVITRVWVKAGANHSGDGPGYGERFDAPEQVCQPAPPVADAGAPPDDDAGCFVADGTCNPGSTPPKAPSEETFGY